MSGLLALLILGCAIFAMGVYVLVRAPAGPVRAPQHGDILLADVVPLRALPFKNFSHLFSDKDYRELRSEPKLIPVARQLKHERRRLALNWLAALASDIRELWRLRRLLVAFGISQGRRVESSSTMSVISMLLFISGLRICVFFFGPFFFHEVTLWTRGEMETYTRSCQTALWLLPKDKWSVFSAEWSARRIAAT